MVRELPEVSWGWQKTRCGPFAGVNTSLPGGFPVWCRREHAVGLAGACSHILRLFPALVAQKLEKALPGRVQHHEQAQQQWSRARQGRFGRLRGGSAALQEQGQLSLSHVKTRRKGIWQVVAGTWDSLALPGQD